MAPTSPVSWSRAGFLRIDATYLKARPAEGIMLTAVIAAVDVNSDGHGQVLGEA